MIYVINLHKYTLTKKKIETAQEVIKASSLDTLFRDLYRQHGFIRHDLHHVTTNKKDYLYRIKIAARYNNEMEFFRSEKNEREQQIVSNVSTLESSQLAAVGNFAT